MNDSSIEKPVAKTGMLIRRPIAEVFAAFIDPKITTQFWFTKSSGPLEVGKQVEWVWEMYNFRVQVMVKEIEVNKRIVIEWGHYPNTTIVEWLFEYLAEKGTYVRIINHGFQGNPTELMAQVSDSTQGFTFVLAGAKALLEHGIQLNLVADAFPSEIHQVDV